MGVAAGYNKTFTNKHLAEKNRCIKNEIDDINTSLKRPKLSILTSMERRLCEILSVVFSIFVTAYGSPVPTNSICHVAW